MRIILLILKSIYADDELDEFINKDIKIYFSGYPSYVLGIYNDGQNLVARNKYINFTKYKFSPVSRLIKNRNEYEMYFSGKRMCKQSNVVSICTYPEKWTFTKKVFGYNIIRENKCITKGPDDTIVLKQCTESDDQLFSIKSIRSDCDPTEDFKDKHTVHVNVFPNSRQIDKQDKKQITDNIYIHHSSSSEMDD